jgi:microcompartment protein CcmL/EutN
MQSALGLIETRGMVGVIEAADAAAKAAHVRLVDFERIGGGLVALRFYGDVASVQTAVEAGVAAAQRVSEVVSHHIIARPHSDLLELLENGGRPNFRAAAPGATERPVNEELHTMSVSELRQLVRQAPRAHLKGRQVSRANKQTLIAELERLRQEE